jgi:tetraacyldisaccharide 4'-kinase
MNALHGLAEKVRRGEPIPLPLAALLSAATPLYRLGMRARLSKPRITVDAHVISFGNITAGGTGKTPAVIERAQAEIRAGKRVAILTRGYRGKKTKEILVRVGGADTAGLCDELGDEPALIASKAPEALIVRSPDRLSGARKAIEEFGCEVLILDDGFQYVQLERDENVLVVDASNPFGNGHLLPRGILREPLSAMARATHVLLTRCDQADDLAPLLAELDQHCPGLPVRKTRHAPRSLWRVADGESVPLESLNGEKVAALCGIGNPEGFFATVEALGAIISHELAFPDHGVFPQGVIPRDGMVVTTEKDAMRLRNPEDNVYALGVELEDVDNN